MRILTAIAFGLATFVALGSGGAAAAATTIKTGATPERLGECAIGLNEWKTLSEVQTRTVEPQVLIRLNIIMDRAKGMSEGDSGRMAQAMTAKAKQYGALSGMPLLDRLRVDLYACDDEIFDTDTPLAGPTSQPSGSAADGPFAVGAKFQVSPRTPPSYVGYCILTYESLRELGDSNGVAMSQTSRDALSGFEALLDAKPTDYRNAAWSSKENRASFYRTFRGSHSTAEYLEFLKAEALDCGKWIIPR